MALAAREPVAGGHVARLSRRDGDVARSLAGPFTGALLDGGAVVCAVTPPHRDALRGELASGGVDVDARVGDGRLVFLDAVALADALVIDGALDNGAFEDVVASTVRTVARRHQSVSAFGEIVAVLWDAGDVTAAVELERLWDALHLELGFSLVCAYPAHAADTAATGEAFAGVCHAHSALIGGAPVPSDAEATCLLEPVPVAARRARRWVTETLGRWGYHDVVDDAALVVTELATNAVVHADSVFSVSMARERAGVRLSVGDTSPTPPMPRVAPPTAAGGRGLALIAAVSAAWRHDDVTGGKIVTVELGDARRNVGA